MMEITLTCEDCGSAISIYPTKDVDKAKCQICNHEQSVKFNDDHFESILSDCPSCERKDFYKQKDFNRKIGVIIYMIAAAVSTYIFVATEVPWYAPVPFIVTYAIDFFLFQKLDPIAICYKCHTIFRNVKNIEEIHDFNHEMNDRIIYADHDFGGEHLDHH